MKQVLLVYRKSKFHESPIVTRTILIDANAGTDTDTFNAKINELVNKTKEEFTKKFVEFKNATWSYTLTHIDEEVTIGSKICKHCGTAVEFKDGQWKDNKSDNLNQYCWTDPVSGSQLHEV